MIWKIKFFVSRLACLFVGCQEKHESGWNMPDDWQSPTYCDRCGACDDVYGYESTPFHLLYSSDKFIWRLEAFWKM